MPTRPLPSTTAEDVLDALPVGAMAIDTLGLVRYANRHVRERLGWQDGGVGRSLFDIVVAADLGYAATVLAEGQQFYGAVLGPMRIRFVAADGTLQFTEFWARELDDRSGYVLVAPYGSVIDVLTDAVQAIATGEPIERAFELIVTGFGMHPMTGRATLLRVTDDGLRAVTPWPFDERWCGDAAAPWQLAVRAGRPIDVNDLATLGDLGAHLADHGVGAVWSRPVIGRRGAVNAVIVVARSTARPPTANQQRRMDQLVNVAALAFDQLEYHAVLEQAAFTDELTGAATRARLRDELARGLDWSALLYVDLDGFKTLNDEHGHEAGDTALAEIGERLLAAVRNDDLVVRLGGDEFLVVLGDAGPADTEAVAQRLLSALRAPCRIGVPGGDGSAILGASIGICLRTGTEMTFDDALRLADTALGAAKHHGKGRYEFAE